MALSLGKINVTSATLKGLKNIQIVPKKKWSKAISNCNFLNFQNQYKWFSPPALRAVHNSSRHFNRTASPVGGIRDKPLVGLSTLSSSSSLPPSPPSPSSIFCELLLREREEVDDCRLKPPCSQQENTNMSEDLQGTFNCILMEDILLTTRKRKQARVCQGHILFMISLFFIFDFKKDDKFIKNVIEVGWNFPLYEIVMVNLISPGILHLQAEVSSSFWSMF